MNDTKAEWRARCRRDVDFFLRSEWHVTASADAGYQGTEVIRYDCPNGAQVETRGLIGAMTAAGGPVLIQNLKTRQVGGSTEFEGHIGHGMLFSPGTKAVLVSYERGSTTHILALLKTGFRNLRFLKDDWKIRMLAKSVQVDNGSFLDTHTAGNRMTGHSFTYNMAHFSERSRWKDPEEAMKGLGPATKGAKFIIDESTANGRQGAFYEDWQRAVSLAVWLKLKEHDRRNTYVRRFVPYHQCEWYTVATTPQDEARWRADRLSFIADGSLEPSDLEAVERHGLTLGQALWRRATIHNPKICGNDEAVFEEQYPTDPETAFLSSGRRFIPTQTIFEREALCKSPMIQGDLRDRNIQPSTEGPLWIWRMPERGRRYLMAVDPGLGEDATAWAGLQVLDAATLEQVCEYSGPTAPVRLAEIATTLAHIYNEAMIGPDRRNHGAAFVEAAMRVYGYYHWFVFKAPSEFGVYHRSDTQIGFFGTEALRDLLMSTGKEALGNMAIPVYSQRLVKEASTLQVEPGKNMSHVRKAGGCRDDLWTAWIQAVYMAHQQGTVSVEPQPAATTNEQPGYNTLEWFTQPPGSGTDDTLGICW